MTAQIHDSVNYCDNEHALVAYSDGEPFSPVKTGYLPVPAGTACWRGYVCRFRVKDNVLHLNELRINHRTADPHSPNHQQPPELNGIAGTWDSASFGPEWLFHDVDLPLAYTGGLVIGHKFIRSLYVHMGFHPAWNYEHVDELRFEQGRLIEARTASADIARLRMRIQRGLELGHKVTPNQIDQWLADCFYLDYGRNALT
jgi:hypothetical protein